MKLIKASDVPQDIVREPGAKHVTIRRLIDTPDGADRFLMSMFELGRNGATPPHKHEWEHEIYVLSGSLRLELPDERRAVALRAGDVAFIPRGEAHGLATGPFETARLLLVAPAERPPTRSVFFSNEPYEFDERLTEDSANPDGWPSEDTIRLHRVMFGYLSSKALFSALELGVFDALEAEPATAEALADRVGIPHRPARLLLIALQGDDLVERDEDGTYRNAPVSGRHLVSGRPDYLGALAVHQAGHFGRFARLTEALRSDAPVETSPTGDHPAFGGPEKFAAVTRAASLMMVGGLVSNASLKGHRHMVDLGCGSAVYTIAFANANPELRITAVDRPAVCELARRNIAEAGLADRVTVVEGDIFTDTFGEADVALLSNVVEGFAPDRAQQLLRHVYGWLPKDGELLLHAHMWEHGRTPFPFGIGLILLVNNTVGGEPYGAQVTEGWLREVGFDDVSTMVVSPISALARAHKP